MTKTAIQKRIEIINKIEKVAKEIFGPVGILPIQSGGVEIIPAFGTFEGKDEMHIILYKKQGRTDEILWKIIQKIREYLPEYTIFFNDQPENLWRKF